MAADNTAPTPTGSKVMHGARAQVIINGITIGVFTSVSYNFAYDITPVYVLGAFSPRELVYTSTEPVSITASGFRSLDEGPFDMGIPMLNELLAAKNMTFSIFDRQTSQELMTVTDVKFVSFGSNLASRSLQDMTINFQGLTLKDHGHENIETDVTSLP